jgi:hypothetical protein
VALTRKRTIPTERPPLVSEVSAEFADRGCRVVSATDPHARILGFLDRSRYYFFQVAPQFCTLHCVLFFLIRIVMGGGVDSKLGPHGTSVTNWPIAHASGDCEDEYWQGETEVLGENLPQRHSVDHKTPLTRPVLQPGPPRWEAGD